MPLTIPNLLHDQPLPLSDQRASGHAHTVCDHRGADLRTAWHVEVITPGAIGGLFWIALLLVASWASPIRANDCEAKALEIARGMGLDAGQRTPTNSIPLSARTEKDGDYGAYLLCNGTLGMTLQYLSPPSPGWKWFEFVGRSGTILTKVESAMIALEARNCVENARFREATFRSPGSALQMVCSVSKIDERAEIFLAAR